MEFLSSSSGVALNPGTAPLTECDVLSIYRLCVETLLVGWGWLPEFRKEKFT